MKQIASKHDDEFVKNIINELNPQSAAASNPTSEKEPTAAPKKDKGNKKASVAMTLGIIGIISAWLFAIVGHAISIVGIVLGCKEKKETGKSTGLIVSVIGEICAIISSIIGFVSMM